MADKPVKDLNFEDALTELEDIVNRLERGDTSLDDSIKIYQRGAELKAHCEGKLKAAQLKVEKIVLKSSGAVTTEAFDAD